LDFLNQHKKIKFIFFITLQKIPSIPFPSKASEIMNQLEVNSGNSS
jgi:hypothetical protein